MKKFLYLLFYIAIIFSLQISAQDDEEKKDSSLADIIGGLKFRSIGPAYCSGRIADFAVNPKTSVNITLQLPAAISGKPLTPALLSNLFLINMELMQSVLLK
jgi:hypothetical protein